MNFKTFMAHLKIFFVGNKNFLENGWAEIPCKKCNKMFISYAKPKKMGTYDIDTKCPECKSKEVLKSQ